MRSIKQRIVGVIVMSADGKFCAGKKAPHPQAGYQELWHLPGGGVDVENETDEKAARRELLEETGIDTSGLKMRFVDGRGRGEAVRKLNSGESVLCKMIFYVYQVVLPQKAEDIEFKPKDSEFAEIRWFPPDVLLKDKIKFVPATYGLFERLGLI
jgi:8-oxo-dGTP pyrophosphatase MutT (NUDIX family)